jgi:integrase
LFVYKSWWWKRPCAPTGFESFEYSFLVAKGGLQNCGLYAELGIIATCFATHLWESGCDIQIIKRLLGHRSLSSTINYLHVSQKHLTSLTSPLDLLEDENNR